MSGAVQIRTEGAVPVRVGDGNFFCAMQRVRCKNDNVVRARSRLDGLIPGVHFD